jgi:hypothetical protein
MDIEYYAYLQARTVPDSMNFCNTAFLHAKIIFKNALHIKCLHKWRPQLLNIWGCIELFQ